MGSENNHFPTIQIFFKMLIMTKTLKEIYMDNNILSEKNISFNEIEKKIFMTACEWAQKLTKYLLESIDKELAESRDKKEYRSKGKRKTTIKTVYGEVEYSRHVYETKTEAGKKAYLYLLDREIGMDKIGLISTNLAEKITATVVESPFRVTAKTITETCGQSISHGGVWNVVQMVGEKMNEEEDADVKKLKSGSPEGKKEVKVLFEEMDGLWIKMQGHSAKKAPGKEMKIGTVYEGWDTDSKDARRLVGKTVIAGMEKSSEFLEKREAQINSIYNTDEIELRILNGDGGSWISDPYGDDIIEQLDRFHVIKAIREKIAHEDYQKKLRKLLGERKIEELIEAVQIYADSVAAKDENDKKESNALELKKHLENNKEKILRYDERDLSIPQPPEGVVYKGMGVQENQNATVIAMRMKHGRKRWKEHSANNMAKLLYHNENGNLLEKVKRYTDGALSEEMLKENIEILSAAKAPKKDGKGSPYVDVFGVHMPIFDSSNITSAKMFKRLIWGRNC